MGETRGRGKQRTGIEGSWASTIRGRLTVGVEGAGVGVSNGEKGGITVTEQQ